MYVYKLGPSCPPVDIYDITNAWQKKKLDSDTNCSGLWCNMEPLQDNSLSNGTYAYISSKNSCPSENCIKMLREEINILKTEMKLNDMQHKKEINTLKAEINDLKSRYTFMEYDNILCDCISEVYEIIVSEIRTKYGTQVFSWASLVRFAKKNPECNSFINEIVKSMGFTDNEWVEIRKFKEQRNNRIHTGVDVTKAYNIIDNFVPKSWPADLREGLRKIVSKCE